MSTRTTTLALEVVSEVDDAVAGLGRVDKAAEGAAAALDKLEAANDAVAGGLDRVAGATDALDSKAAAATGAVGALASGFDLIGAEGAAEALGKVGLATDFLSGVGQTAALAMEAQGAATKVLTGAQKALNIVMRANPIGLLVTGALLLIGGLVLLYKKSETFRDIVQSVGKIGKAAFDAVVTGAKSLVTWVSDRIPAGFSWLLNKAQAAVRPATDALEAAKEGAKSVWDWVGKIPAKFGELKDKAGEIAGPLLAPFTAVRDAIQWIIDKLGSIKIPDWFDKIPGVGRVSSDDLDYGDATAPMVNNPLGRTARGAATTQVSIVVQGALDPNAVAAQIRDLLTRYGLAVS